jgi:hypothetical protein
VDIEASICRTAKTLDLTSTRVDIMKIGARVPYLTANLEWNAHRIVDMSQIQTEICSIEYLRQNLRICNYAGLERAQS